MNLKFFLYQLWDWFIHHGIPLTALVLTAILVPRVGRLAMRLAERQLSKGEEATKTRLALIGALVYVCLLYTSPSPRDLSTSRMPSSA